jgi:hypothetical protein
MLTGKRVELVRTDCMCRKPTGRRGGMSDCFPCYSETITWQCRTLKGSRRGGTNDCIVLRGEMNDQHNN